MKIESFLEKLFVTDYKSKLNVVRIGVGIWRISLIALLIILLLLTLGFLTKMITYQLNIELDLANSATLNLYSKSLIFELIDYAAYGLKAIIWACVTFIIMFMAGKKLQ